MGAFDVIPDSERVGKGLSPTVKIIAVIVLAALLLYGIYAFFVDPMSELNIRIGIAKSFRLRMVAKRYEYTSFPNRLESQVKYDGRLISVTGDGQEAEYYELEGDKAYRYIKLLDGQWLRSESPVSVGDISEDSVSALLDPDNYERASGKQFTWSIKEGVNTGIYSNVELRRRFGKTVITASTPGAKVTFTFDRIGTTSVDAPWETDK